MPIVIGFVLIILCWVGWVCLSGTSSSDPVEDRLDFFTGR